MTQPGLGNASAARRRPVHPPAAPGMAPGLAPGAAQTAVIDRPAADYPADGYPAADYPADGYPADGYPAVPVDDGMTVEQLLHEVIAVVDEARTMPLSASVIIPRQEVLALLDAALRVQPAELQRARHLLKEREEMMSRTRADAGLLIDEARTRVAQMVQQTEVVRTAERRARQLIDDAEAQARRRRHEIDDYCERMLERFDSDLTQVLHRVQAARGKLAATYSQHPDGGFGGQPGAPAVHQVIPDSVAAGDPTGTPTRPLLFDQDKV